MKYTVGSIFLLYIFYYYEVMNIDLWIITNSKRN